MTIYYTSNTETLVKIMNVSQYYLTLSDAEKSVAFLEMAMHLQEIGDLAIDTEVCWVFNGEQLGKPSDTIGVK